MNTKRQAGEPPRAARLSDARERSAAMRLILELCLPGRVALRLAGVGDVVVRPQLLEQVSVMAAWDAVRSVGETVVLECAGQRGLLVFGARLAAGLVNGILGLGMPPFAGPLCRIERGVLEGVIACFIAESAWAPGIRLCEPTVEQATSEMLMISASVESRGESSRAWLAASPAFFESAWANLAHRLLPVAPCLELAATSVPRSEMALAVAGDKVVFDETAGFAQDVPWPVRVRWGGKVVPARWLANGRVVAVADGFPEPSRDHVVTRDERPAAVRSVTASAVGDAMVEVRACLEWPAFDTNGGLLLFVPRDKPVVLTAGDQSWASGAIVECDGAFAVEITRRSGA